MNILPVATLFPLHPGHVTVYGYECPGLLYWILDSSITAVGVTSQPEAGWQPPPFDVNRSIGNLVSLHPHRFGAVGTQLQDEQSGLLNWPISVEVQPSLVVQVIVYSPVHSPPAGLETQCILEIVGVVSQPQSTAPKSMICAAVGSMLPGQLSGGREKAMKDISHGFPMFTIPVPVAMQPSSVLQVMV